MCVFRSSKPDISVTFEVVVLCCNTFLYYIAIYPESIVQSLINVISWRWFNVPALKFGRALHWRHNDHNGVSNHQPHRCLLNRLFRSRSKKTSKLRVTGLCAGNSPGPVNSRHKGPVMRKMFPFDDVIMWMAYCFLEETICVIVYPRQNLN